jgi:hypothetical protein
MTLPKKLPRKISAGLGLSLIDRAVKEFFADRRREDLQAAAQYFTDAGVPRCIYCNASDPSRWDHFHPVTKGGDTIIGNLVPACQRCDDSKQDRTLEEWVNSRSKHRPQKEQLEDIQSKLREYQLKHPYQPRLFDEKLSQEQKDTYRRVQQSLGELRRVLEEAGVIQ